MSSPRNSIEKQSSKSKYKILRLIPKVAQASVSFQNHSLSPGRENWPHKISHKLKSRLKKTFSGPLISMIPTEAREKTKIFENEEPNSPKISCMGQIKHKNKISKQKKTSQESMPVLHARPDKARSKPAMKKISKTTDGWMIEGKPPLPDRAPSISQMRRFASSRDTLADFDWMTMGQIGGGFYSGEDSDGEDDAVNVIHFSAPILMTRVLEPRKEVNLWRRRTMAQPQPQPLQLNIVRAQ